MASRVPQVSAADFGAPPQVTADDFSGIVPAAQETEPAEAGFFESLGEVPGQLLKLVTQGAAAGMLPGGAGIEHATDVGLAQQGDPEAARRARAFQTVAGATSMLVPGGPALRAGGVVRALAARSALGATGGAFGLGAEAAARDEEIGPAALTGAAFGATLGPLLSLVGHGIATRRAAALVKAGKPVPPNLAAKAAQEAQRSAKAAAGEVELDPVRRVMNALDDVPDLRKEQEVLRRAEKGRRIRGFSESLAKGEGEAGFRAARAHLAGQLPRVEFGSLRELIQSDDITTMFNLVRDTRLLSDWEKNQAGIALENLFSASGVSLPRPFELKVLEKVFGPEFVETIIKKQPQLSQLKRLGLEILSTPREIMSSFDLSAPFRQGLFAGAGHPKEFLAAFGTMLKSIPSKEVTRQLELDIATRPTYELMQRAGLALTRAGSILGEGEEVFRRGLSRRIPGLGAIVDISERTYTNFLNKLRADVFDSMVKDSGRAGLPLDDLALQRMGEFVNAATGRGNLPRWVLRHGDAPVTLFYSPRLIASRLQLLNPRMYIQNDPIVRQHAVRSLLSLGTVASSMIGLAALSGADVETDPTQADWGKIKVGNTRYDILGGFQQYLRLGAQIAEGAAQGDGVSEKLAGAAQPTLPFLRKKLAPVPSLIADMWTGKDFKGDDFSVSGAVMQRFSPMVLQDLGQALTDMGWIGLAATAPAVFGVGVQTYE